MDGYIVGSMISANSIVGEQIQANTIKATNLELSVQKKIQDATNEETVKALIKADLDGFESTLSKEFVTVENATTQIQQATEVAVKEATQSIIDNAVTESMGAVDGQLNDKLNQYTGNTLLPAIAEKAEEVLQNAEDYVVTQLESYATKQELSSSISQTREQIELSVSEKYTTKTESATIITEAIDGITVGAINRVLGTSESKSFKFNGGANETWLPYKFSNDVSDKEVFVSFKYTLTGTAQNGSQIQFAPSYMKKTNNQTVYQPKYTFFTSNRLQDVNITNTVSFTTKDFQDISPSSTSYIRFVGNGFTGTLSVSEVQIKPGNSKTTWSPAPEDTIADITNAKNDAINSANGTLMTTIANYYTKSETNSAISIAKDSVTTSVSNLRSEVMSATYTNLLENSDFLILDGGFPRGYSRYTINSNTSVSMSGWSLDGGKAVRITSAGQTDNVWIAMFSPFVKAHKGETFTASVFITTNDYTAIDNQVAVEIEWYSDSGRIGTSAHFFTKTYNGWERQSVTGTAPDGTTKARMRVHVVKNGTIYVTKMMLQTGGILTNWVKGGNIDSVTERLASAEQKITDSAIISTVSKSFYTKTETDGKVTTVQNSMNSSITQLSNQIATKVDVNGVKSTIEQNPSSVQIGFNKISDTLTVSADGLVAKTQSGNKYFQLGYNGMTMYNPANGTHQWGKVAAINNKFTVASNGNSSGLSLGHHVNENYVEDILCDSNGVVSVQRQMNHNGVFYNNYGQMFVRQSDQGGWEITGRSDSQSIKPGGANQGAIGSNTQYINQSWIANRYNPSSLEIKHLSHYVDDLECLKLVSEVQPARYFYKEYDEEGNDITTFTTKTSQLGLIYEDVRECSGRDLLTNEEDKAINSYGMVSVLWGAVRNLNERLNKLEYENALLNDELQNYKQKEGND